MGQKERYHMTLDSDLVKAAERLEGSRSENIEKALRLMVSGRTGHAPATDKQTMASQEELAELKNKFSEFIKENKESIDFLTAKAKKLTEKVNALTKDAEQTPTILKNINEFKTELVQILQGKFDFNKERDKILDFANRLRKTEMELNELLNKLPIDVKNDILLLSYRMAAVEGRLTTLDGKGRGDKHNMMVRQPFF